MTLRLTRVEDVEPQLWRNGGGYTRELLAWPSTDECDLRIAVADIEDDGPFSAYPGVERWITVISGVGIALTFSDGERELAPGDAPLCFDGAAVPGCRMLAGPTRDLNLMVRRGSGVMRSVQPGVAWNEEFEMRGVFAATSGRLTASDETFVVPAMTLLWTESGSGSEWIFEHDAPSAVDHAWWLGFTPPT